jgi:hypothetical protein
VPSVSSVSLSVSSLLPNPSASSSLNTQSFSSPVSSTAVGPSFVQLIQQVDLKRKPEPTKG